MDLKERKSVKNLLKQPQCITGRTVLTGNGQCFILHNVFSVTKTTHIPYYYFCLILAFSLYSFWLYDNTRRNLKPMWVILVTENTLSKIKHCPFLVNTVLPVRHRGCFNKVLTDFLSFLHGLHHIHFLKIKFS